MMGGRDRQNGEWAWVVLVSLGIVLLASLPYLFGYAIAPSSHSFVGLTYNVDDALVYMSWMRQAADGHFFTRNLFTSEPQAGRGFNLFFYALGRFAAFTHLPLIAIFHLARVLFGVGLLVLIYAFARLWISDLRTRRLALIVAGLSAGLGWLVPGGDGFNRAVDLWQPEAITFLSIYLSPLFSFSMILMLGSLYLLYLHSSVGRMRYALFAGISLLLLGNIHSYDVIPIALTWAAYAVLCLLHKPRNVRPVIGGLVAALIAIPSVGYQAYQYAHEPVFRLRADVPTLSPSLLLYVLGFGLLIPLAALGVWRLRSQKADYGLLACWGLASIAAAYLPFSFQRKLIMGIHIPLSVCAAVGIGYLCSVTRGKAAILVATAAVLLLMPSNALFEQRDMSRIMLNEPHTTAHPPFISMQEVSVLSYLRNHTGPNDIILAEPSLASLAPAYTGRTVYCGHWGETARFEEKVRQTLDFFNGSFDMEHRRTFLRKNKVSYVVDYDELPDGPQTGMSPVLSADGITVYRVR